MQNNHYKNIIIGGGPAGLNLALEFQKRNIAYLLAEAQTQVGGQWDKFPVCGQLISLNKKYVPGENHTYKMRYDWHTLSSITAEDAAKDPMLRFTEWTSEHWPSARLYKKYLQYVAQSMKIMPQVKTNTKIIRISKKNGGFSLLTSDNETFTADRIFCGTGTSEEITPEIEGLDSNIATYYTNYDPDTAKIRYKNKIVLVIGGGNSAFEIAHNLVDITAETRVITRSLPLFAKQTHNVHDLRAQVSDVFDLMQLKSNNNIVSDKIVKVERITEGENKGRILVHYKTPCVHWNPPRWMKRKSIVDDIIICCGFNYTLPDVFDTKTVKPATDNKGKYCLLSSSWESINVPGLYFIGAPMRVNDPDAASGFVHGFRCNIQALGHIIAERYHHMPIKPVFECDINLEDSSKDIEKIAGFLVKYVSNSMPLFELFKYFSAMVTLEKKDDSCKKITATVWPAFPREYNEEKWHDVNNKIEIIFEYGFGKYADGELPTHYFTLPADHFDTSRSAYIHPVFHVYRDKQKCDELHMQESLISRWDIDDYIDKETNSNQYKNVAYNAIASALSLKERRSTIPVMPDSIDQCYPPMSKAEINAAIAVQPTLALLAGKQSDIKETELTAVF